MPRYVVMVRYRTGASRRSKTSATYPVYATDEAEARVAAMERLREDRQRKVASIENVLVMQIDRRKR